MLDVKDLTVCVDQKIIIQNISFQIQSGSIHAFMGKNGSGKSSLAHTIMGMPSYQVTEGSLYFNKKNLLETSLHERSRSGIFLAFQQPVTIPGVTVFQFLKEIYVTAGNQVVPQEFLKLVQSYCDEVGLDYSFLYRSLHENFSGGEKKRLEIVQMLLLQPSLIILDEIDSGLDVDALRLVGFAIKNYLDKNSHASCLIITHYCRILEYIQPNFVHVMHAGHIVRSGHIDIAHEVEQQGYDFYGK